MSVADASKQFMVAAQRLPTLFDLEDDAYRLLAALEDTEEPEDIAAAERQLALVDQLLVEKVESYVSVIRTLEAMADAREAEERRLRDRKQSARAHADWLKQRLLTHLQVTGRQRVETARFTLSIRQNPAAVQIVDEAAIPADYVIVETTYRINKRGILEAYKRDGEVVPGTEVTRGERLSIA